MTKTAAVEKIKSFFDKTAVERLPENIPLLLRQRSQNCPDNTLQVVKTKSVSTNTTVINVYITGQWKWPGPDVMKPQQSYLLQERRECRKVLCSLMIIT